MRLPPAPAQATTPVLDMDVSQSQSDFAPSTDATDKFCGYEIGAIGRLTQLHARVYHNRLGWDSRFEVQIARELADFIERFNATYDAIWLYKRYNAIVGCLAVDGSGGNTGGARLRFLIVDPQCQRNGIAKALMRRAVEFCRTRGITQIAAWTTPELFEARQLYEKCGFVLSGEMVHDICGRTVTLQQFQLTLQPPPARSKSVSYGSL